MKKQTYNYICFSELVYEFEFSNQKETKKKIKRRLKYYNLGDFDLEQVNYLRKFKNDLYKEISLGSNSQYYCQPNSKYAEMNHFDIEKIILDYTKIFSKIKAEEMEELLKLAVYVYYLR